MTELEARTICVDLDGVVCNTDPSLDYAGCAPVAGAADALRRLRAAGFVVVLHTARHFNHWHTTVGWLQRHAIPYDQIVFGKPPARWYVDDRAVAFDGDWDAVARRLLAHAGPQPLAAS